MHDFLSITLVPVIDAPIPRSIARESKDRPSRGVTKFPGSSVFAEEARVNHSHLYRVLTGERTSRKLVNAFAAWLKKNNMPWPAAAKAKPQAA